jgi:hypothetical protein
VCECQRESAGLREQRDSGRINTVYDLTFDAERASIDPYGFPQWVLQELSVWSFI